MQIRQLLSPLMPLSSVLALLEICPKPVQTSAHLAISRLLYGAPAAVLVTQASVGADAHRSSLSAFNGPQEEALAVTGQLGAQAAAQWVLDRPESTTQWSIVKQGSFGSVLCSRASPAVYSQPALEVIHLHHCLLAHVHNPLDTCMRLTDKEHVRSHARHQKTKRSNGKTLHDSSIINHPGVLCCLSMPPNAH